MIPVGLSQSANYFVGTYIGMGLPAQAKQFSRLCNIVANFAAAATMALVFFFENPIMDFYHPQPDVKKAMMQAWIVLLAFIYFDCMQAVSNSNI
jgi:Na+-driven multidrug efflux pump